VNNTNNVFATPEDEALHLNIKQIKNYFWPTIILGPIYASILIYGILNNDNKYFLIIWFCLVMFSSVVFYYTYSLFEKQIVNNKIFIIIGTLVAIGGGAIWGSISWIVPMGYDADFLYILFILIFINFAPQIAVSQLPILHRSFVISCFTVVAINPYYYGIDDMYWLVLIIIWLAFGLLFYGNLYAKANIKSQLLDIENQKLVKQLSIEKQAVERESRAKTQFLAAASHDLRQPLQAQHFFISALQNTKKADDKQQLINNLQQSTKILGKLLNSLLDISKLDAGVVKTNIDKVEVENILQNLNEELSQLAKNKNIKLKILSHKAWVESDAVLLENILRNLITNAIRYTKNGYVLVGCMLIKDKLNIEVRDSGIGINNEQSQFIFDEFYQINNQARDREKGLGLGLSIVKRLSGLLNHKIEFDKNRVKGAKFILTLNACNPVKTNKINIKIIDNLAGKTILIIDDDSIILDSLSQLLDSWYCNVIVAKSANQGIDRIKNIKIDVVISDFNLGDGESGDVAIEIIRKHMKCLTPAILLTGETSPEKLSQLNHSSFNVLHKPVSPLKLKTTLANIVDNS
jgi:signal transduction histidine kinase